MFQWREHCVCVVHPRLLTIIGRYHNGEIAQQRRAGVVHQQGEVVHQQGEVDIDRQRTQITFVPIYIADKGKESR